MNKEVITGIMLTLLFMGMLALVFNIQPLKADWTWTETVYIRADGSVDPDTAPISTFDNVTYTLTDNIVGAIAKYSNAIVVERDDIVIDGAGYTLQGTGAYESVGIELSDRSNVTIKNMEIRAFDSGIHLSYSSKNNTMSRNNITNNDYGIKLWGSSNNTVSGNNITANDWYGILFYLSSNYNTVSGNSITSNGYRGIELYSSSNNSISRNDLTENRHGTVLDYSSNYNSISGNNITNNDYNGIVLSSSSHNSISGNNITANKYRGILFCLSIKSVQLPSNNTVSGNSITSNGYGISLDVSRRNTISENNIAENNWSGIELDFSSGNTISENSITNSEYGIWIASSSNNKFYHNNFVDNIQHVYDMSWEWQWISPSLNLWDNDYPSGGNYWSDYEERYPDAEELDGSGIWDTPYIIDVNNRDRYPLMYPWGTPPPPSYTIIVYSSPTGVTFTVNGVSRTTPWSRTYGEDTSVSLIMPEIHSVGDARYYWNQWSDGNTSRSRTGAMTTNITLTAHYTGPYYELTVTSSPITGITFTTNETPQTTPYTEWLLEGSYTLIMPQTHDGYKWFHWQEDGDTNRTKIVTMDTSVTLTGVFTPVPPPHAVVDIDPDTLNLKSKGKWITSYIELPEGYNVSDINRATILLNDTIPVDPFWVDKPLESVIGDYDSDTISDLMVKFDRQVLIECLKTKGITGVEVTLTITGEANGISFEVTDTIKVIGQ